MSYSRKGDGLIGWSEKVTTGPGSTPNAEKFPISSFRDYLPGQAMKHALCPAPYAIYVQELVPKDDMRYSQHCRTSGHCVCNTKVMVWCTWCRSEQGAGCSQHVLQQNLWNSLGWSQCSAAADWRRRRGRRWHVRSGDWATDKTSSAQKIGSRSVLW